MCHLLMTEFHINSDRPTLYKAVRTIPEVNPKGEKKSGTVKKTTKTQEAEQHFYLYNKLKMSLKRF